MLAFSPDLVDPSDQLRRAAAERAQAMAMPTAQQEVWRYSRIGELQLDRFHPTAPTTKVEGANGYVVDRHDLDTSIVHDVFDELSASFYGETVLSIPLIAHVACEESPILRVDPRRWLRRVPLNARKTVEDSMSRILLLDVLKAGNPCF